MTAYTGGFWVFCFNRSYGVCPSRPPCGTPLRLPITEMPLHALRAPLVQLPASAQISNTEQSSNDQMEECPGTAPRRSSNLDRAVPPLKPTNTSHSDLCQTRHQVTRAALSTKGLSPAVAGGWHDKKPPLTREFAANNGHYCAG